MAENISPATIPCEVAKTVEGQKMGRHPVLSQGFLLGHWKGEQKSRRKDEEAEQQVANFSAYARNPSTKQVLTGAVERLTTLEKDFVLKRASVKISYRLVIGVGVPNPIETGITLHPLYGVPYLPGTAVKGVTQAYLLQRWAAAAGIPRLQLTQSKEWDRHPNWPLRPFAAFEAALCASGDDEAWDEARALVTRSLEKWRELGGASDDNDEVIHLWNAWRQSDQAGQQGSAYAAVFGTAGQRGKVAFLDALPRNLQQGLRLRVDVLTSHFSRYYSDEHGAVAPSDDQSPIPVPFLVVDNGQFELAVLAFDKADAAYAEFALDLATDALKYKGIGAKTGSGYGRLS